MKLPGVEALGNQIAGFAGGLAKQVGGNLVAPVYNLVTGNGGYASLPNGGQLGEYVGGLLSNAAKDKYRELTGDLVNKIGSKVGRQIAGALFANVMSTGYGTGQLRDLVNRGDPHLLIDWSVIMPALKGANALPDVYVESADFSAPSFGSRRIQLGTTHVNYPAYKENSPINLVFAEDANQTVSQYLNWWRSCIRDPDGTYSYPSSYKADINILALTPDGKIGAMITLVGCYPDGPLSYPYASGTSEYMRLHQSFACDHVAFSYPGTGKVNVGPVQDISTFTPTGDPQKDAILKQVTIT